MLEREGPKKRESREVVYQSLVLVRDLSKGRVTAKWLS